MAVNEQQNIPHEFQGRHDRDCATCGLPDRSYIHKNVAVERVRWRLAGHEQPTREEASALVAAYERTAEHECNDPFCKADRS